MLGLGGVHWVLFFSFTVRQASHGSLVSPTGLYVPLHCVSLLLFVTETGNRMRVLVGLDFVNIIRTFICPVLHQS